MSVDGGGGGGGEGGGGGGCVWDRRKDESDYDSSAAMCVSVYWWPCNAYNLQILRYVVSSLVLQVMAVGTDGRSWWMVSRWRRDAHLLMANPDAHSQNTHAVEC